KYWLENVKDWCISRQLWWGHQIPAWYDAEGKMVVAETELEAKEIFNIKYSILNPVLTRDADVLDTWFSSWLWPTQVFKGITEPGNAEVKYYYPGSVLVTGQDIIFFWVARMVMAGMEYEKQIPFKDVYFTGMVRDKLGRKMSKSLGNSPDLLDLIDRYGADAVRFGIMVSSPAGNDLMFDEASLEQGRNFNNKIWNALKLLKMWEGRQTTDNEQSAGAGGRATDNFALNWFENKLIKARTEVDQLMKQFRLSEALKTIYSLVWDDFCSWYLEWIKPGFEQPIDGAVYHKTISYFEDLMQLLHPFMPFVTEEIYHLLKTQTDDLCVKQFAAVPAADEKVLKDGELLKQVITTIRDGRNKNQLKPKEVIRLFIETGSRESYSAIENIICKQVNAGELAYTHEAIANTIVVAVEKDKFYIKTDKELDTATLKDDLLKDLEHQKGFLAAVEKKLSNEKFVQNAKPEVLALEQKKKADAEARIRTIEESLSTIS
ncbi:MAG: class I tRNA ligase family protein, partial [Ferruginibacter sp.]